MLDGGHFRGAASGPPDSGLKKKLDRRSTEAQPPSRSTLPGPSATLTLPSSYEKGKWSGYHEWQTTCKATNHPRNELEWELCTATGSDVQTCAAKIPRRMRTAKSRMNCHGELRIPHDRIPNLLDSEGSMPLGFRWIMLDS